VVILLIAWAIAIARGSAETIGGLTKTNWTFLVLSGCATGLSWICYFKASQLGKVSQVAPIDKLSVALAIILAILFLKESLNIKQAIGAVMIIGGSVVLIFA
jgi:transporter family protein